MRRPLSLNLPPADPSCGLHSIKIESSAMLLRQATLDDIPAILALERTPMAREFVGQWSEARHRATLAGGDARYLVSETEWGEVQAYAILRGIQESSRAIELKRIVVAVPERGIGRRILSELMRIAFRELDAHRLFLDVYEDNARARHLYESLGFQYEGVMRDAARREDRWCNLHLMSILESEYS
jgi:diamine N-acetyltransferase